MNKWLLLGGGLSLVAAFLHIAIIFGGPEWYRFFGAGEGMARAAARGSWRPALITITIVAILLVWSAYAFAGAGLVPHLPHVRVVLVLISAAYLIRAAAPVGVAIFAPDRMSAFVIWSSLVVLLLGAAYAIGTWTEWDRLPGPT